MIARPNQPKRDDLYQNASFWNPKYVKRGAEMLKLMEGMEGEGASKADIFKETNKLADMKSGEVGMYRGAAGNPGVEIADNRMRIKPEVATLFDPIRGGTTAERPLGEFVDAPDWFDREPLLKNVKTRFIMPERPGPGEDFEPGGGGYTGRNLTGGTGKAEMKANAEYRRMNSSEPFSLRGLVNHEIGGHAVADFSGFGRGDSPDNPRMKEEFNRQVIPRSKEYQTQLMQHWLDHQAAGMSADQYIEKFPEASSYLEEANRLIDHSGETPRQKAIKAYENVAGESEANMGGSRLDMPPEERIADEERFPWLPIEGKIAPYELQLLRTSAQNYAMPDDRGTLARLMRPASMAGAGGAAATMGMTGGASAADAAFPEVKEATADWHRAMDLPAVNGPRMTPWEETLDRMQSVGTSLRNTAESTLGTLGDYATGKWDVVQGINDFFQDRGSSIDQSKDLDIAKNFSYNQPTGLPTTEDVHGAVDSVIPLKDKEFADRWTAHEPQTEGAQSLMDLTDLSVDPMDWLTGAGAGLKGARWLKRFAR